MAADRSRLAAALAYKQAEEERRQRMMQSVPTTDNLPPVRPARSDLRTNLENLSSGIGQGIVNQLEGVKSLVTDPVGTARAAYEGVKGVMRDPSVLADALRYTAQKATSGPLGAGEVIGEMVSPMRGKPPVMQEIDVYHGSPHRFEEFDASKIGTGEGAQAYGHGTYLAESPNVAKSYAIMDSPFAVAGLKGPAATVAALAKIDGQGNPVKFLEDNYESQVKKFGKQDVDAAIASLKRGNLYTAALPDEMVDRMLDWDKPLSEQPESVRKAVQQINAEFAVPYAKLDEPLGFYVGKLGDAVGGHANASKLMASYGVPGIRYLDAGSRGQGGSGTRNFVVFPGEEKKVKILKRE